MLLLSATDAISPALNRTRDFLFRPFRWGTYLKLCATAVITEGFFGNFGRGGGPAHSNAQNMTFNLDPGLVSAVVAMGIIVLVLAFVLLYVISRLRFALFHCLVHQTRELSPGWNLYREQALRFFLLTIMVALGFLAVAAVALSPFIQGFVHLFQQSRLAGRVDFAQVLPLIAQLIPVLLALALLGIALDVVLRDFMLPHMALENASVGDAWSAVLDRFAEQKGAFVLYALLRVLLPFAAMIGIFIVLAIPMVFLFGIPGVMMAGIHAAVQHAAGAAWLAGTLLEIALGVFLFALGLLIAVCVGGPLSIAVRNYALLFYGGRYRALGDVLSPPPHTAPDAPPLPA